MAGKAINEYGAFTGNPDAVNILVQEKSQGTDHSQAEHKKADLDALLNKKIVQTITDNDTTHVPSADAVYDALLTESTARANADTTLGQNITAEATARQSADTTLGQRINATNKRVTNLEQKAGDEIVVDYPSSTYGMDEVPANVAEYAKVTKLRGVSRVKNQLVTNPSFATETDWIFGNCNHAVSNNILTMTATALRGYAESFVDMQNGHIYLFSAKVKLTTGNTSVRVGVLKSSGNAWANFRYTENTTNWQTISILFELTGNEGNCFVIVRDERESGWDAIQFADVLLKDVTLYFGGSIPSDADTIAKIQTNYPHLLTPSDYGVRIVDSSYSGVRAEGVNIWDEVWETGQISWSGNNEPQSNRIRSKNYIPVLPSTLLYYKAPKNLQIFYYDIEKNFIRHESSSMSNASRTTPSNCYYIRFYTYDTSYGGTYLHDIQICLDSYADKTTYHPYMESTLTLPEPVPLKGVGSVAEEYDLKTGRVTHPIAQVDLGTLNWKYETYAANPHFLLNVGDTVPLGVRYNGGLLCTKFIGTVKTYRYLENLEMCVDNSVEAPILRIRDDSYTDASTFKASLSGVILYYELATPSADTYVDPIIDPFIKVEGGGSIRAIQSQTEKIDHAFTAEYLAV